MARYRHDLLGFVHDCIDNDFGSTFYQDEIMAALLKYGRVAVRGPHGLGKTAMAAWVTLWGVLTSDDVKVITTASHWRQLTKYLWPEIHKWAARLRWDIIGRPPFNQRTEQQTRSIRLGPTREAFPVASDNPAYIEGAHARRLIYIFDEAKAIPDAIWDAAEGAFSTAGLEGYEAYALAISTPGEPAGRFYDIHRRARGFSDWWVRHVTLDEMIEARRIGRDWAEQRRLQWGEDNPVYLNRVLGEFASSSEDTVIMLSWVEAAQERWHDLADEGLWGPFTSLGVDVGHGRNQTVIAVRHGNAVRDLRKDRHNDTMYVANLVHTMLTATRKETGRAGPAVVDVVGGGAGVVDRLRELGHRDVVAFNAGERTDATDASGELAFANKRSAMWWRMRELLRPDSKVPIALPPDDDLTLELITPHWKETGGKIQVESKDDIARRLSRAGRGQDDRSTDTADAVLMAFWADAASRAPVVRVRRAAGLYSSWAKDDRIAGRRRHRPAFLRRTKDAPKEIG